MADNNSNWRKVKVIASPILVVGIYFILFQLVGFERVFAFLLSANPLWALVFVFFSAPLIYLSCLKWKLFLKSQQIDSAMPTLMKHYTIGYFFNSFVPSQFGGDIARSYRLGSKEGAQTGVAVATFLEKATGLIAMLFLAFAVVSVFWRSFPVELVRACYLIILTGALASVLFLVFYKSILRQFSVMFPSFSGKLNIALSFAAKDRKTMVISLMLSLLFHILTVFNVYLAALVVGWQQVDFSVLFVVVPVVLLISMVPITPSGMGVQEGAFMFFLQGAGATAEQALACGLALRVKVLLLGAFGGLLLLTDSR